MLIKYPRAIACGDSGVSIEFGDCIDELSNRKVLALDSSLQDQNVTGIIETVPTYRALMIHYDPIMISYADVAAKALNLANNVKPDQHTGRFLRIPVCYEGDYGPDLQEVSDFFGMRRADFIDRHLAGEYRVFMLGFQPGFAYLGGLDPSLVIPRRAQPRFGAPAGTISIAAGQCAVHAVEGPSGWHWIGRTPLQTFAYDGRLTSLIEPGDRIKFYAVSADEWRSIQRSGVGSGEALKRVS